MTIIVRKTITLLNKRVHVYATSILIFEGTKKEQTYFAFVLNLLKKVIPVPQRIDFPN